MEKIKKREAKKLKELLRPQFEKELLKLKDSFDEIWDQSFKYFQEE